VRIHVLSDLHLEFGPVPIPNVDADAVVLAGDISVGFRGVEWAARTFAGRPILYVPGNHEFYGQNYPRFLGKLRSRAVELDVRLLSDMSVTIAGVRFVGATLWTDFLLLGNRHVAEATAHEIMTDFRKIRVGPRFRRVVPADMELWHHRTRSWLERELAPCHSCQTVIVTHHAPSLRSLRPLRPLDPLSAAFASGLDDLVERSGASYWIHGHTHHCVDYMIGQTRVVSNQRGYPDEAVPEFNPAFIIEVESTPGRGESQHGRDEDA
jgi:predicted phosphodiesterase